MKNFRDLKIWSASHNLALEIYKITKDFPSEEKFGITSQLKISALSIPTNISEGSGCGSDSDFSRFLQIAFG
ncbi:MAG: S23 ribosomal protein [Stygiobacter sp.]|nr:MAG: S23 ribosomal protein [Stygiobacter sp.]KAF0210571.1 MAG: S23 ribosomal [Ignavibacteria bacterium]